MEIHQHNASCTATADRRQQWKLIEPRATMWWGRTWVRPNCGESPKIGRRSSGNFQFVDAAHKRNPIKQLTMDARTRREVIKMNRSKRQKKNEIGSHHSRELCHTHESATRKLEVREGVPESRRGVSLADVLRFLPLFNSFSVLLFLFSIFVL